jgi:high-affinity Fe2+/Pb2+ permease
MQRSGGGRDHFLLGVLAGVLGGFLLGMLATWGFGVQSLAALERVARRLLRRPDPLRFDLLAQ